MTEDNGAGIPNAPEENIVNAPNAIGPNIEFAISPHGLLRVAFSQNLLMSAFYCDAEAARIMSKQFGEMADKLDQAHEELQRMLEVVPVDTVEVDNTLQIVRDDEPTDDTVEEDKFQAALDDESTDPPMN